MNYEPFLRHLETIKQYTPATLSAYNSDLKLITDHLRDTGIKKPRQITQQTVVDLVNWMKSGSKGRTNETGLADASIARRLAALSGYLDYVQATLDPAQQNPVKSMKYRWRRNREPKPVHEDSLDLLLSSIDNFRDKTIFYLLLATGLRVSELAQLNRDTIKFEAEESPDGTFTLTGSGEVIGKGRKRRTFFVGGYALELLAEYLEQRTDNLPELFLSERKKRMSVRAIQERLSFWCKKYGFAHINVHRLRHTYATRLANANINSMHLMALMGHESLNTTRQYFKLSDKTLSRGYFAAMEYVSQ